MLNLFNIDYNKSYDKLSMKQIDHDAHFTISRFTHDVYILKDYDITTLKLNLMMTCVNQCPVFTENYMDEIVEYNSQLADTVYSVLQNVLKLKQDTPSFIVGEIKLYTMLCQSRYTELCKILIGHLFSSELNIDKNTDIPFSEMLPYDVYKKNYENHLQNVLSADDFLNFKCLYMISNSR
jgi:hypothetical protein